MVNLWPSKEGSEAASRDQRRLGVIAEQGLDPSQIRPQHYDVANYVVFDRGGTDWETPGPGRSANQLVP